MKTVTFAALRMRQIWIQLNQGFSAM